MSVSLKRARAGYGGSKSRNLRRGKKPQKLNKGRIQKPFIQKSTEEKKQDPILRVEGDNSILNIPATNQPLPQNFVLINQNENISSISDNKSSLYTKTAELSAVKSIRPSKRAEEILRQSREKSISKFPKGDIYSYTFGVLSFKEMLNMSVTLIQKPIKEQAIVKSGTIIDPKLGPSEYGECKTCGQAESGCPGHYGLISFPKVPDNLTIEKMRKNPPQPRIVFPNIIFYNDIISVLKCICHSCSALLLDKSIIEENKVDKLEIDRLKVLAALTLESKGLPCPGTKRKIVYKCKSCDEYGNFIVTDDIIKSIEDKENFICENCFEEDQLNIVCNNCKNIASEEIRNKIITTIDNTKSLCSNCNQDILGKIHCDKNPNIEDSINKASSIGSVPYYRDGKCYYKPIKIYKIFDMITDEDARLMGFINNHPRNYLMQGIIVPSPCIRNRSTLDGSVYIDKLGDRFQIIASKNMLLKNILNNDSQKLSDIENIQESLFKEIKNLFDWKKEQQGGLGITQKLKGKGGLGREAMLGKRVNFSARAVITPNTSLDFGQIGIPKIFESQLTPIETVIVTNIKSLTSLLKEGKVTSIIRKGAIIVVRDSNRKNIKLQVGDEVMRYLREGDFVIANRNPTIHKESMMAYEVVMTDENTIQLHLSSTEPHNADFDGDEMNIHFIQVLGGTTEVRGVINSINCMMNAQSNRPMVGLVLNDITGAYLMTKEDIILDRSDWQQLINIISNSEDLETLEERLFNHQIRSYSGRALFSALLPSDFYYRNKNILIEDGILCEGIIHKSEVGTSANSIIQELYKRKGISRVINFLTDAPKLIEAWLYIMGFSVGIEDCILTGETKEIIEQRKKETMLRINAAAAQINYSLDDPYEIERNENRILQNIENEENKLRKELMEHIGDRNNLRIMTDSESKGSNLNITQMVLWIGQTKISGARVKHTMTDNSRSSPYSEPDSLDAISRGFIENSFSSGLNIEQFLPHLQASRLGLIDKAVKISKVGDASRYIRGVLSDLKMASDGTVRDAADRIIQFLYGNDGFDPKDLQPIQFPIKFNKKNPIFYVSKKERQVNFINLEQTVNNINIKYGYEAYY